MFNMGDATKREFLSGVNLINSFELSDAEKEKAIKDYAEITSATIQAHAKAVNPFVSGRSRLTSTQKSGVQVQKAADGHALMKQHIDSLEKKSNKNKKEREDRELFSAFTQAMDNGDLEVTVNGKTYRRTRRNSKTFTLVKS